MTPWRALSLTALTGAVLFLAGCDHSRPVPVPRKANAPCADTAGPGGFPLLQPALKTPYFVCHKGSYALEFNPTSKTALWVSEHVLAAQATGTQPIQADFRADPDLSSEVASQATDFEAKDYGMAVLASPLNVQADPVKVSRTFYLSNSVPMPLVNRKGIWNRLEKNIQAWGQSHGELYVISGPVFLGGQPAGWIGGPKPPAGPLRPRYSTPSPKDQHRGKLGVPTHVFKVVYDPARQSAIGFVIPNTVYVAPEDLPKYAVPVRTIEQLTYLRFFPNLPNHDALVSGVRSGDWLLGH